MGCERPAGVALRLHGLPRCGKVFPWAQVRCPCSPQSSGSPAPGVEGWPLGPGGRVRSAGKSGWRAAELCAGRLPLEGVPRRFPSLALDCQGRKLAWVTARAWGFLGNVFALFHLKISQKQLDSRILSVVWQEFAEPFNWGCSLRPLANLGWLWQGFWSLEKMSFAPST